MTITTTTNGQNTNSIQRQERSERADVLERVVAEGDLAALTPADRIAYYLHVCKSVGLNAATRPFLYIILNGKLTLYTRKDATDQLRSIHSISIRVVKEDIEGCVAFRAIATKPDGRTDESIGAVPAKGLAGEALANAWMKAETKAKRRVTLSICGLGFVDESEIDSIPGAQRVTVTEAGEVVIPQTPPAPKAPDYVLTDEQKAKVRDWEERLILAESMPSIQDVQNEVNKSIRGNTAFANSVAIVKLRELKEKRTAELAGEVAK